MTFSRWPALSRGAWQAVGPLPPPEQRQACLFSFRPPLPRHKGESAPGGAGRRAVRHQRASRPAQCHRCLSPSGGGRRGVAIWPAVRAANCCDPPPRVPLHWHCHVTGPSPAPALLPRDKKRPRALHSRLLSSWDKGHFQTADAGGSSNREPTPRLGWSGVTPLH